MAKKKVFKSDARLYCESVIEDKGLEFFSWVVGQLKGYYYRAKNVDGYDIPTAINTAAEQYLWHHESAFAVSDLKSILGHVLNVPNWWSPRKPVPIIIEGMKKGQLHLFIPTHKEYDYKDM